MHLGAGVDDEPYPGNPREFKGPLFALLLRRSRMEGVVPARGKRQHIPIILYFVPFVPGAGRVKTDRLPLPNQSVVQA